MKKGFTLVELICVVVILTLLFILAIPSISNLINNEENNISSNMEDIIKNAAALYVSDYNYLKNDGSVYCIEINELINNNYLSNPLKDPITGDLVDTLKNKYVRVWVSNGNFEYLVKGVSKCEGIK